MSYQAETNCSQTECYSNECDDPDIVSKVASANNLNKYYPVAERAVSDSLMSAQLQAEAELGNN